MFMITSSRGLDVVVEEFQGFTAHMPVSAVWKVKRKNLNLEGT